jgi:hypothetical protein
MTLFFTPSGLTSPTCVPSPLEFLSSRRFQWCSLLPFRSTRSFSLFAYGVALSISFSGFSGPIQQRARLTSSLEYGPTWRLRRYISRLSTAPLGDFNAHLATSTLHRPTLSDHAHLTTSTPLGDVDASSTNSLRSRSSSTSSSYPQSLPWLIGSALQSFGSWGCVEE